MALYPIRLLKDKNRHAFFPFNTLESVLVDGTNLTLKDVLDNIYTKPEINTMFATELSKFSVYDSVESLPATARDGAVAAVDDNDAYYMYMYYDESWHALTQKGDQGDTGSQGPAGPYFTPSVNAAGDLSWTNNGGLTNPETRNIKGPQGLPGVDGTNGQDGQDGQDGADGFSPTATVSKSGKVATISITDKNGTTTVTVSDGDSSLEIIDISDYINNIWNGAVEITSQALITQLNNIIQDLNSTPSKTYALYATNSNYTYFNICETANPDDGFVASTPAFLYRIYIYLYDDKWYIDGVGIPQYVPDSAVKNQYSNTSGNIYDVTYINSMLGDIESLLGGI